MSEILRPLKFRTTKNPVFGFDIETYSKKNHFYMGSIVGKKSTDVFYDREEIKNHLLSLPKGSIISATNLAFDFFGTFKGYEEGFNFLYRGSDLLYAKTYIKNNILYPTCMRNSKRITFIDTFNYVKMSVEKMGKVLNIPKLDKPACLGRLPKSESERKELEVYNIRDSTISREFIKFLYSSFHDLGSQPKNTIASSSMTLWRTRFQKQDFLRHKIDDLKDIFKAYYGGRTEALQRGKIKNYNYYDFNSLYPSVMINDLPDPNTHRFNKKGNVEYIERYEGVSDITISSPYMDTPFLPFRQDKKLIFPIGTFRGWYSHVEIRKALSLGYEINKIYATHYYTGTINPFKDYVNELYKLRLKYQKEESSMEVVVKLCLNSLYGKFGQNFMNKDRWHHYKNVTMKMFDNCDGFERIQDFIRVSHQEVKPSTFCIPIWPVYITSYARIKMFDALKEYTGAYCDTDSIMTKSTAECSDKLGDLKKEAFIKEGIIVRPKFYGILTDDGEMVKVKGLGKRMNYEKFLRFVSDPTMTYEKFVKFKESKRRGFGYNEIIPITKNLSLEDEKRIWQKRFSPIVLQDSKPIRI